jgi:hypothetical protein
VNGVIFGVQAGLVALALVFTMAFVGVYGFRAPWRSTPIGRLLLSDAVVVTLLLGISVWGMLVGPAWWPLTLLGTVALCAVAAWRLRLAVKAQRGR